jgi:Uma2 family endonuclease
MTLEKYEALIASGVFTKRDKVQLVDGYLVARMSELPPHGAACEAARLAIEEFLPRSTWHIRNDKPLRIPGRVSMPEPDLVVVRGTWRAYASRNPEPPDAALVVEVANSSLDADRAMADIYGLGGVSVYGIVNLVDRQVEVYSDLGPNGYQSHQVLGPGHALTVVIDGVEIGEIQVADILP